MSVHSSWLRRAPEQKDAKVRLLCLAHAGAGATSFNGWARNVPPHVELVRVQLPGREDNGDRPAGTLMDHILPELTMQVEPLLDRPLAIYGHCLGALIAFELARDLRRRGHAPLAGLFVSGRRPPQQRSEIVLYNMPEPDLLNGLREMGALSPLLTNERWRRYYLDTIRADLSVTDNYRYVDEPPLSCPLHVFVGVDDPRKEDAGWERQTSGEYAVHMLPGGHFFSKEGVQQLIAKMDLLMMKSLGHETRAEESVAISP